MKRDKVLEAVNDLPQEFELEELLEKLIFVEKVENGLLQLQAGQVVAHATIRETVKKW